MGFFEVVGLWIVWTTTEVRAPTGAHDAWALWMARGPSVARRPAGRHRGVLPQVVHEAGDLAVDGAVAVDLLRHARDRVHDRGVVAAVEGAGDRRQ